MGEFASKGVAGSGLGLGIAGTALGVLSASQNGGGLLGGLFGGGMNQYAQGAAQAVLSEKDAMIARLQAEKYSDKNDVEVYAQTRRENGELGDRLLGNWIQPLAKEAAALIFHRRKKWKRKKSGSYPHEEHMPFIVFTTAKISPSPHTSKLTRRNGPYEPTTTGI